jgi:glutathione S-transferase/RNA polymerase-associated protein
MTILLYEHPLSPYAQKCKIALAEKGVAFETRLPNAIGTGTRDEPFLEANPRGEVPALIEGEVRLFDSTIILEYIEDRWPTPPMLPATPYARARARMIEEVMDTQYEAITWAMGEVSWFKRAEGEKADELRARARMQLDGLHHWLARQLGDAQWFNGESFGWGDLSVIPYVNGATGQGLGPDPASPLGQWQKRCNARPSVIACNDGIKAIQGVMVDVASAVKAGLFKREYRDHRLEWMMRSGGADIVIAGMANATIRFSNELS